MLRVDGQSINLPFSVLDVLLRCLESLERKARDGSEQQETSAALKEVTHLRNSTYYVS